MTEVLQSDVAGVQSDAVGAPWDGGVLELLFILIVFFCILALAYFTTRVIAKKSMGRFKSRYIEIIDTLSVGGDTQLLVVKVVDEFFLVSRAAKQLTYLTKLELEMDTEQEGAQPPSFAGSFRSLLEGYLSRGGTARPQSGDAAAGRPQGDGDAAGDTPGRGKSGIFKRNIDKIRRIAGGDTPENGDGGYERDSGDTGTGGGRRGADRGGGTGDDEL